MSQVNLYSPRPVSPVVAFETAPKKNDNIRSGCSRRLSRKQLAKYIWLGGVLTALATQYQEIGAKENL